MKIWEIIFWNGQSQIVVNYKNRQAIRKDFIGIREINAIIIH